MTIFYTSDTHFGHANIIRYCERPFASADEMDEALIRNWNAVVSPDDTVWHLGDFAFPRKLGRDRLAEIFAALNGTKHLIQGNHDPDETRRLPWATRGDLRCVEDTILCHYPLTTWAGDTIHFHGHAHGKSPVIPNRFDVGGDCWGFRPVMKEQVLGGQP